MSSHAQANEMDKPVFWFTPSAKSDRSEYERIVDEAENTFHLITPKSAYPLLRLKKLYLDEPHKSKVYVTTAVRKPWNTKDRVIVFVLEGSEVGRPKADSSEFLDKHLSAFTRKKQHLWIESIAKTISGKIRKIGTLREDDHCWINLNVAFDELLAERIKNKSINPRLVHALEISKRKKALLNEHEFIEAKVMANLMGSKAENLSSFAYNVRKAGKVFSVTEGRKRKYPLFQFDLDRGEIRKEVSVVLKELPEAWNDWDTAFWFFQDNAYLDGEKPSEMISKAADEVIKAAKYERAKLNG
jgi:hypothetical protein